MMPVIGFLGPTSAESYPHILAAFHQGLKETGYTEGQNVAVEYRWAQGQYDRLPALATELVSRKPSVIVAVGGSASGLAAKAATTTIPIVFVTGIDPGLVQSLSRPGSNITGVTLFTAELAAKRLQMLRELAPTAGVIALLVNSRNSNNSVGQISEAHNAGTNRGQRLLIVRASSEGELDAAFTALAEQQVGALLVDSDSLFGQLRKQIVGLAAHHKLPAIYDRREFAEAGGLVSYGADFVSIYRQSGSYAGRILRGEKTADLPVMEPTKFELVINLKTAKALGLTLPPTLVAPADEVIE